MMGLSLRCFLSFALKGFRFSALSKEKVGIALKELAHQK